LAFEVNAKCKLFDKKAFSAWGTGIYQLTVDAQGAVTQIQTLKRFGGSVADVTALKTLIRSRAKPGPMRVVNVPWSIKRRPGGRH